VNKSEKKIRFSNMIEGWGRIRFRILTGWHQSGKLDTYRHQNDTYRSRTLQKYDFTIYVQVVGHCHLPVKYLPGALLICFALLFYWVEKSVKIFMSGVPKLAGCKYNPSAVVCACGGAAR
jgi:hypothetical protein